MPRNKFKVIKMPTPKKLIVEDEKPEDITTVLISSSYVFGYYNIKKLVLRNKNLQEFDKYGKWDLCRLVNLDFVTLSGNFLTKVVKLAECTNLTEVDISQNRIKDITPLFELKKLERLFASNNLIETIFGIERC